MLFLQSHEVSPGLATKIYRQYGKESLARHPREPLHAGARHLWRRLQAPPMRSPSSWGCRATRLPRLMTGIKHALSEAAIERWPLLPATRGAADTRRGAAGGAGRGAGPGAGGAAAREGDLRRGGSRLPRAVLLRRERHRAAAAAAAQSAEPRCRAVRDDATGRRAFAALEREQGIHLAERQRAGGAAWPTSPRSSVLTGGPGVGKTTTLRALLMCWTASGVQLRAGRADRTRRQAHDRGDGPPGRARCTACWSSAQRTTTSATTSIARCPSSFVIVDEVSMLDILLAYRLVRAVAPGGASAAGGRRRPVALGRAGQRAARIS